MTRGYSIAGLEACRLLGRPVIMRDRETEGEIWWQRYSIADDTRDAVVLDAPHWLASVSLDVAQRYGRMRARAVA